MPSANLAQNQSIEIGLDRMFGSDVSVVSRTGNDAGCVLVLEGQVDNEWVTPLTMINGIANPKAEVANLTGAAKYGYCDMMGFQRARVRRTDANAGAGWAEINATRR